MTANYFQAVFGLILCLGLILVLASFAKRHKDKIEKFFSANLFSKPADKRLRTVERLPIAPGHTAIILEKDGVEHFIILSPQSTQIVDASAASQKAQA